MLAINRRGAAVGISTQGALAASVAARPRTRGGLAVLAAALVAGLAALATLGLLALVPSTSPRARDLTARQGLAGHRSASAPVALAASASAAIGAGERSFWAAGDGDRLGTSGGGIASTFTSAGAQLRVRAGSVGVSLAGVGRGARIDRLGPARPSAAANQVAYRYGSVSEYYRNGPYGLEQAFSVGRRPAAGGGSLVLALGLSGSLRARQAGSQVLFAGAAGATALRYGGLTARDATGRLLPSAISVHGATLELVVDDSHARYPLRIDPFFQQGSKLTGAGEVGRGLFGYRIALSADGNTALIGGPSDNARVGAAWVFTRSEGAWTQQGAKLTGSEESGKGRFGASVALSADGNTALAGGYEDATGAGAAWVFTRSEGVWTQQGGKLTGAGEVGAGHFGFSAALSSDGNTALIGGVGDNSEAGAAWVFTRSEGAWTQQGAKLTGAGEVGKGEFGVSAALSGEGNTALIGGGGDNAQAGAAWVFTRSAGSWTQQGAKLTGAGEVGAGHFGFSVALSGGEGNTALIGAGGDNSEVGAAWLFVRSAETWQQLGGKLTGGGEAGRGHFGFSVALSADALTAMAGGVADNAEAGATWAFVNSPPIAPTVVTGTASGITATSATLNATVDPNGENVTDCHFEYGTSLPSGSTAPCTTLPGSGSSPVPVSATVTGLGENTTYHFRIVATNSVGTSTGSEQAFATSAAPEFGRCVKVAKGVKGGFQTSICNSLATPEKHSFEWEPGPGPKAKFTTKNLVGSVVIPTVTEARQVHCSTQTGTGEYVAAKTVGNVVIKFTGCELEGSKCASAGAEEGAITTNTLEGVIGLEKRALEPKKNKIALDLFPVGRAGPFMEFTCATTSVVVRGSVLAPVKSNAMLSSATVKYLGDTGKQKPQGFEGQPKDVLETAFGELAFSQSGLTLTTVQTNEEKIEINSVV